MKFLEDELLTLNGKPYPTMGGRLRLAHEGGGKLSIKTEIVKLRIGEYAVARAVVTTERGEFTATGVATISRDIRIGEALCEASESRAVARALRFAGYGYQIGVEEIGDLMTGEQTPKAPAAPLRVVGGTDAPKTQEAPKAEAPRRQGTPATSAQQKAIYAISKKLGSTVEQTVSTAYPGITASSGLSVGQASALIDSLKSRTGNGANGSANK